MMKYTIVQRGDAFSASIADELMIRLAEIQFERDELAPEVIFTVGGDGTMLKAVHKYIDQIDQVVFVGIHTGKLGFYTDFVHNELDELLTCLKENTYSDIAFPLLEAHVCQSESCLDFYALNEITLINAHKTQHLDIFINNQLFESFQGTGICVATPTGSSAYNKSMGGALVHPNIPSFQLTEIGSINNNVYRTISSSMIFPKDDILTVRSRDFDEVTITVDHTHQLLHEYEEIIFKLSDKQVTLRQYRDNDFWKRVKKSFL
jgi:NAD+ kinase